MRSLLALLTMALVASSGSINAASLHIVPLFPSLTFKQPVAMVQLSDEGRPQWLVVEKRGTIQWVEGRGSGAHSSEFADLRDRVDAGPTEAGLLGIALHPQFEKNHTLFLSYTRRGAPLVSVIARYKTTVEKTSRPCLCPDHSRIAPTLCQS